MLLIGLLFGIGFGFFVQRAGLCFSQGFASLIMGKGKRILTIWFIILIVTSIGFLLLGLKPIGQIRGAGFFNILSGIIFGAGIALSGGCVLGTLRQLGEGNLFYLIVWISFIPGMWLVVKVLDPMLLKNYNVQNILIPQLLSIPAGYVTGTICVIALFGLLIVNKKK
ncbi:MAG: YeeE/YedE family protein [Candidatus Omnitrophica bacterium]|nr:YeeE/YedE family protein [Candidatus Omnitrophota bacterium]